MMSEPERLNDGQLQMKVSQALDLLTVVRKELVARALTPSGPVTSPVQPPVTQPPSTSPPSLQAFAWGKRFSPAARTFLNQTAADFSWHPDWLPSCIAFETGETFSPSVKNPHSSGTGLIQFMDATCVELTKRWKQPVSTTLLRQMTVEEQLPWVWKYMRMMVERVGNAKSLEDVYMLIYWPSAVDEPLDAKLHSLGTSAYAVNKGLDTNRDGVITKREAGQLVRAKLAKGRLPENYG